MNLPREKRHLEFRKLPIEKQVEFYLIRASNSHPSDLSFADDAKPPSRRNWAVTVWVERVKEGKYSQPEFTFTIHSAAKAGLAVGRRCTIEAIWTGQEYVVDETRLMN